MTYKAVYDHVFQLKIKNKKIKKNKNACCRALNKKNVSLDMC